MICTQRLTRPLALAVLLILALAAPAGASVASEQQQGAQILSATRAGKLTRTTLSSSQYEHVGEYLMGQALGSTEAHQRMNSLMDQMMGPAAGDQMHVYLGERYLGHSAELSSRYASLYGLMGVMMSGNRGSPIASMMGRYLSGQSQTTGTGNTGGGMMGYGYQSAHGGAVSTGAIVGIILGSVALLSLLILVAVRKTGARKPPGAQKPPLAGTA